MNAQSGRRQKLFACAYHSNAHIAHNLCIIIESFSYVSSTLFAVPIISKGALSRNWCNLQCMHVLATQTREGRYGRCQKPNAVSAGFTLRIFIIKFEWWFAYMSSYGRTHIWIMNHMCHCEFASNGKRCMLEEAAACGALLHAAHVTQLQNSSMSNGAQLVNTLKGHHKLHCYLTHSRWRLLYNIRYVAWMMDPAKELRAVLWKLATIWNMKHGKHRNIYGNLLRKNRKNVNIWYLIWAQ